MILKIFGAVPDSPEHTKIADIFVNTVNKRPDGFELLKRLKLENLVTVYIYGKFLLWVAHGQDEGVEREALYQVFTSHVGRNPVTHLKSKHSLQGGCFIHHVLVIY